MTCVQSLSASKLLDVWEQCADAHPVERALSLLSACCSETQEELANLSIGQRDTQLLKIYARMFGSAINCFAQCPAWAEPLEYHLAVDELVQPAANPELSLILETEEMRLSLRLLNSRDLQAMRDCSDSAAASMTLLERCVIEASHDGNAIQIRTLPESIVEKIASRLVQADPLAETLIDLTCCACRHSWQVILDIESLLWAKINTLAKRLLQEVHALSRTYGWREQDILALSARRRQAYLEMAVSWPTF